jgi:hypothetical protein
MILKDKNGNILTSKKIDELPLDEILQRGIHISQNNRFGVV